MESSICQFDRELQLLHREKLRLYPQLKLADLRQLTLYQELRLLQEFEGREEKLQEKLSLCIKEENSITVRDISNSPRSFLYIEQRENDFLEMLNRNASFLFTNLYIKHLPFILKRDKGTSIPLSHLGSVI